jgi:hypothetical protein
MRTTALAILGLAILVVALMPAAGVRSHNVTSDVGG